jgi:hypothetical protein
MEYLKKDELKINDKLYLTSAILTFLVILMFTIEFFSKGTFPEVKLRTFYIGVLVIYAIHKEVLRWIGIREIERRGEIFVYLWITFSALIYIIDFFSQNVFTTKNPSVINDITLTSLEVLAIFILSRISKIIQCWRYKLCE